MYRLTEAQKQKVQELLSQMTLEEKDRSDELDFSFHRRRI